MLHAELRDANGRALGEVGGDDLGFSLSSVASAVSSAYKSVSSAVDAAAGAACRVLPAATTIATQASGSQYQSTIAKAASTAQNLCAKVAPQKVAPAPAPRPALPIAPVTRRTSTVVPSKYPAGSVQRYNVTRGVWSIYAPKRAGLGIFSGLGIWGPMPVELPPAGTEKIGEEPAKQPGVPDAGQETDKPTVSAVQTPPEAPFYKKPLFWVAVVGGVAVVGTGGYLLLRRKPAAARVAA